MTYWHMQLHPNDLEWKREKELLETKNLIGLGLTDSEQAYKDFQLMKKDDIVLIKHGANPIALVKVKDDQVEDIGKNDFSRIDWFKYRRKIEVLDYAINHRFDNFPQPRGTLQKSITPSSVTYRYINNWYKILFPETNNSEGMQISRIEIENHKMFKNFSISFQKDDEILPVIILAGVNGCGKTTLLEYIDNFIDKYSKIKNNSFIKIRYIENGNNKTDKIEYQSLLNSSTSLEEYFKLHIEYLPTDTHKNLVDIETAIKEHLNKLVWNEKESVDNAYNDIKNNLVNIFNELPNFNIDFDSLKDGKTIMFSNQNDDKFSLDELSTGQKTLFTKILYLYLNDVRNKVVLIDEPEISLHPSWQNMIFQIYYKFAKENNCQIIMATHSPNIIANTPHKYIKILFEEDNKIVTRSLDTSPLDRDLNTIVKTIMGTDYIPQWLEEKHFAYRAFCEKGQEDSEEAQKLKSEILEYESPNSSFFQGLAFDMELMR